MSGSRKATWLALVLVARGAADEGGGEGRLSDHTPIDLEPTATSHVSSGMGHYCALMPEGYAACWGKVVGSDSQDVFGRNMPDGSYSHIASGYDHMCAIRRTVDGVHDGKGDNGSNIECLGKNFYSSAGDFGQFDVPAGAVFTRLAAGYAHTCGILESGSIKCWGGHDPEDRATKLRAKRESALNGDESKALSGYNSLVRLHENWWPRFDPPKGEFIQISATYNHTCGLRAGSRKAVCWGASKHKQLKPPSDSPLVRGPNGEKVRTAYHHVAAGYYHTCAILNTTRRAVCWGLNSHGQARARSAKR